MNDYESRIAELEATVATYTNIFSMLVDQLAATDRRCDMLESWMGQYQATAKLPQTVESLIARYQGRRGA